MTDAERKKLDDAIARQAGAVLSVPVGTALRHHKSRLLAARDRKFLVQSVHGYDDLFQELIAQKQPIGLTFRGDQAKVACAAVPLAIESVVEPETGQMVKALLMDVPVRIKVVQRRGSHRVRVGEYHEIGVRVWRMLPKAQLKDRPRADQEIAAELRDVSTGGIGVVFRGATDQPPKVCPEDRLRIELHHADTELLLEGQLRGVGKLLQPNALQTGIRFRLQSNNLDDRQKVAQLTRMIGKIQREEIRRLRLGISA